MEHKEGLLGLSTEFYPYDRGKGGNRLSHTADWAENDVALGKELTYGIEPLFRGPFRAHYVLDGSHWANEEQSELVNRLLLEFLDDRQVL